MARWTRTAVVVPRSGPSSPSNFFREAPSPSEIVIDFARGRHFFSTLKMVLRKLFPSAILSTFLIDPPVGTMYFPLDLLS